MSDEPEVIEEDEDAAPPVIVGANEVAAIIPELDGKGGTQYRLGETTYDTMEEAQAAFDEAVQGQPGMAPVEPEQQPEQEAE